MENGFYTKLLMDNADKKNLQLINYGNNDNIAVFIQASLTPNIIDMFVVSKELDTSHISGKVGYVTSCICTSLNVGGNTYDDVISHYEDFDFKLKADDIDIFVLTVKYAGVTYTFNGSATRIGRLMA